VLQHEPRNRHAHHLARQPLLKDLRGWRRTATAYRKQGRVWLEGDHLCRAALARGLRPAQALFCESVWASARVEYAQHAIKSIVIADALWAGISALESPARMGFVLDLPAPAALEPLMRPPWSWTGCRTPAMWAPSCAARRLLASARWWRSRARPRCGAPKVLRAGMGAHFGLRLIEGADPAALDALAVPVIVTSSHQGELVQKQPLPWPCAWALGHEGQGVGEAVASKASMAVRIGQPGGEESLNVAAAAAICLHASAIGQANAP
jgi:TrmH family RNA methyltransferase